jgi:hypothetical protein
MKGLSYAFSSRSRLFMALLIAACAGLPTGSVATAKAKAEADSDSEYRLLWVRTILGPCCADWGNHLIGTISGAVDIDTVQVTDPETASGSLPPAAIASARPSGSRPRPHSLQATPCAHGKDNGEAVEP